MSSFALICNTFCGNPGTGHEVRSSGEEAHIKQVCGTLGELVIISCIKIVDVFHENVLFIYFPKRNFHVYIISRIKQRRRSAVQLLHS